MFKNAIFFTILQIGPQRASRRASWVSEICEFGVWAPLLKIQDQHLDVNPAPVSLRTSPQQGRLEPRKSATPIPQTTSHYRQNNTQGFDGCAILRASSHLASSEQSVIIFSPSASRSQMVSPYWGVSTTIINRKATSKQIRASEMKKVIAV